MIRIVDREFLRLLTVAVAMLVTACGGSAKTAATGGTGGEGGAADVGAGVAGATGSGTGGEYIHRQGAQLVRGSDDQAFRFRGVTFSNYYWLSGAAMRTSTDHTLDAYAEVASWNMNTVQLMLSYRLFEDDSKPYTYLPEGWKWLDDNIAAAKRAGLVVILDLITPQGGDWHDQSQLAHDFRLWTEPEQSRRFVAMWKAIAERYANEDTVGAFSLLNEPITSDADGAAWWTLAERSVEAIRSVDKRHLIIVDPLYGTNEAYGVTATVPRRRLVHDDNVLYDIHFYEPTDYTHQGAHWSTSVAAEGGKYPDPTLTQVTGELIFKTNSSSNPSLPSGTSDWSLYEGVKLTISDSSIRVAYPSVSCTGGNVGGTAYFDEFEVSEYDALGQFVRTISSLSVTAATMGLWYPWSSDGGGLLSSVNNGHADETALSIANSTATGLFSTRQVLFAVTAGHQYEITGWMRGDSIVPNVTCQFRLEFFALGPGGEITARNAELIASRLDEQLTFGEAEGVPMAVTEFGLMRQCFEADRGGLYWVSDMIDLLDQRQLSFVFFPYHSTSMGIYGDESVLPSPSIRNDALVELLTTKLAQ